MNRHTQKRRIAARMARRRARIIREDAGARYLRSVPYMAAGMQAIGVLNQVRSTRADTLEAKMAKALSLSDMAVAMCELAVKAVNVRNTPTEVLERL